MKPVIIHEISYDSNDKVKTTETRKNFKKSIKFFKKEVSKPLNR